ncbi:hypothetical protein DFH09DRAFT_1105126 [Mycena vulgaris]|nr:hypothetical protein DFH09DRAFT_1105126 [Mycena vulgaris]
MCRYSTPAPPLMLAGASSRLQIHSCCKPIYSAPTRSTLRHFTPARCVTKLRHALQTPPRMHHAPGRPTPYTELDFRVMSTNQSLQSPHIYKRRYGGMLAELESNSRTLEVPIEARQLSFELWASKLHSTLWVTHHALMDASDNNAQDASPQALGVRTYDTHVRYASLRRTCARAKPLRLPPRAGTRNGAQNGRTRDAPWVDQERRDVETPAAAGAESIGVVILEACAACEQAREGRKYRNRRRVAHRGGIESRAGVREYVGVLVKSCNSAQASAQCIRLRCDDDSGQGRRLTGLWARDAKNAEGGRVSGQGLHLRRGHVQFLDTDEMNEEWRWCDGDDSDVTRGDPETNPALKESVRLYASFLGLGLRTAHGPIVLLPRHTGIWNLISLALDESILTSPRTAKKSCSDPNTTPWNLNPLLALDPTLSGRLRNH